MTTIIVDSGSTKSDWVFISESNEEQRLSTMGFNPVFHTQEIITTETSKAFKGVLNTGMDCIIYFYGSGCWDDSRKQIIRDGLQAVFTNAQIHVYHDLLGAARAACGREAGIACILGTGSNSCHFDGTDVIDNVTSIGFMLGDEGSGTHLGKKLIRHYFYREIPKDLIEDLEAFIEGGKSVVLDNVYNNTGANVYLASYTRFMSMHKGHPFIQRILYRSLSEFIDRHVRKYEAHMRLPINFIGSVAYVFQENLKIILAERNMIVGKFVKQPIDAMIAFHLNNKAV